jgi:hypothetical protein
MGNPHPKMVRVYLDGHPIHVPRRVKGHYAVRGWLGVSRGWSVAPEDRPHEPLVFRKGHDFRDGERYVTQSGVYLFPALKDERPPEPPWSGRLSQLN